MKQVRPPRPELDELVPYEAKESRAEVVLASNEHPDNLPGEIIDRLAGRLRDFAFNRYPDPTANELRTLIAEANGLEIDNVLVGNGGDELIFDLLLAWGGPGRTLLECLKVPEAGDAAQQAQGGNGVGLADGHHLRYAIEQLHAVHGRLDAQREAVVLWPQRDRLDARTGRGNRLQVQ